MSDSYTGVKVLYTSKENIDLVYKNGYIDLSIFDGRLRLNKNQNMFIVLKDEVPKEQGGVASVLCWVKGERAEKIKTDNNTSISSIRPRNKEQIFAFEALLDDNIPVVSLLGRAGVGKTILTLCAALQKVEEGVYDKIVLVRNMSQVGKNHIGFLPGLLEDKVMPFNQGYLCNIEQLVGGSKNKVDDLIKQMKIEFMPLQLIRGASWINSFVVLDEAQNSTAHEILSFGTRAGENSKVVLLGDLQQRDINISKEGTGLFQFVNSSLSKQSELVAHIELIKSERGPVSTLFANVFSDI